MTQRLKLLAFTIAACYYANAQNQSGVRAGIGISSIEVKSDRQVQDYNQLSADFGIFGSLKLGENSNIGAEINISKINGRQSRRIELTDAFNQTHDVEVDNYEAISYVSIPINISFDVSEVSFNFGLQPSIALFSEGRETGKRIISGELVSYNQGDDELDIRGFDFGPRAGVTFKIFKSFALEFKYYYGMYNILKTDNPNSSWRVRQAAVGLRYLVPIKGNTNPAP